MQPFPASQYRVELESDRKRLQKVGNPCLIETPFRSPQLLLFDLGPDEWLLYWNAPAYAARRRSKPPSNVTQLALFEVPIQDKAVGANDISLAPSPRNHLRVISRSADDGGDES